MTTCVMTNAQMKESTVPHASIVFVSIVATPHTSLRLKFMKFKFYSVWGDGASIIWPRPTQALLHHPQVVKKVKRHACRILALYDPWLHLWNVACKCVDSFAPTPPVKRKTHQPSWISANVRTNVIYTKTRSSSSLWSVDSNDAQNRQSNGVKNDSYLNPSITTFAHVV